MKTKHLLLFTSLITVLISSCGSSQETTADDTPQTDRSPQMEQRKAERQQLIQDLNLSPEQEIEVEAILQDNQNQIQELRNSGDDRRAKFQQMRAISQSTEEKMKNVLNEDQYAIYQNYKEEQRAKMMEQMRNRGRGGR